MLNTKKSVALAGVLGGLGLALTGVGAAHAAEKAPPESCQWDGESLHCEKRSENRFTSEDDKKVVVQQSRECSITKKDESTPPRGEKQAKKDVKGSMDCANTVSR